VSDLWPRGPLVDVMFLFEHLWDIVGDVVMERNEREGEGETVNVHTYKHDDTVLSMISLSMCVK